MIYVAASISAVNVLAVLVVARLGHQLSGASHAEGGRFLRFGAFCSHSPSAGAARLD